MANFNKVILVGRLTADPELKQTTTGLSVCSFSIAVNRRYSNKQAEGQPNADFFNIVAWRNTAEFVCRSFRKGRPILVCGQLQNRTWTDAQGTKRYATEVVADEVDFVDSSRPEGSGSQGGDKADDTYGTPAYTNRGEGQNEVDFVDVADDTGLPF
jgi:single-strand DNA-binding protein